jgi:glutathione S-transferase
MARRRLDDAAAMLRTMERKMPLTLYYHPLASFCHKVLLALYEKGTAFEPHLVDLGDPTSNAEFLALWPVGKIPVLHDEARGQTIPETSIIIEYLDRHYPGPARLIPDAPDAALEARLWDRFFDHYVSVPMQKIVTDRLRPDGQADLLGVADARNTLATAYGMIERRMAARQWAGGDAFGIADCSAAPALFYAGIVQPFGETHPGVASYFDRLADRPSFLRVLREARPYFDFFPMREAIPERFLAL